MSTLVKVAEDLFDRGPAANLGANWTLRSGAGDTINASNQCVGNSWGWQTWNANSFNANCYCKVQIILASAGHSCEIDLRLQGDDKNYYLTTDGTNTSLNYWNGTTEVNIASGLGAFASGDYMELRAEGSTLSVWKNGVQLGTNYTDTNISGAGLMALVLQDNNSVVDNWEAGNIVADVVTGGTDFSFQTLMFAGD